MMELLRKIFILTKLKKKNKPLGFMIRNKDLFTILIDVIKKNKNISKFDNKVNIFLEIKKMLR